jgi:hypothetical protein
MPQPKLLQSLSALCAIDENSRLSDVLPWMAPTRTSDPNGVGDTTPEIVHPLQAYWSMPSEVARVVGYFTRCSDRLPESSRDARLWCYGYDIDNMKALLDAASEAASLLHKQVKAARFKRPADAGSEPAVQLGFWQASEVQFYELLDKVVKTNLKNNAQLAPLYREWLLDIQCVALSQFDSWVLAVPAFPTHVGMNRASEAASLMEKDPDQVHQI